MKWKHYQQQAEKYNLDRQNHPVGASLSIIHNLMAAARVYCRVRGVIYRGRTAMILVFGEDDDRRRDSKGARGIKPRWFEVDGEDYDPDVELDSEDEEFPDALDEHPSFSEEDPYKVLADQRVAMNEEDIGFRFILQQI
ncbi:uncharacterized protein FOMMEDRAFT_160101 [Fomitiporia mediterranea MF3/22]|uniref:uncharacterized protein n=1 Tax=Fomitiporia mediterranea (strain MF3/22) TaxID=694068 RepID=UPI00044080C0|nr:uncharacterized protein FOMMEDRAFT_160101 [Fomitiporia mediterranea MF3/22]EJC99675.1 hypothetical protein FOMMEDRAFT_160101 [Fomitiporia mediterranea MF3/22]